MSDAAQSSALNDPSSSNSTQHPQFIIVGGGKMGAAILSGLITSQVPFARDISAQDFLVVNPGEARRAFLSDEYGVRCVADVADIEAAGFREGASSRPLVVVLAVKPQIIFDVIADMKDLPVFQGGAEGPLFVSIAAGITIESLADALPEGARIVRSMPNMPLLVSAGATGLCVNDDSHQTQKDLALIRALFDCLGNAVVVNEDQLDAVCALSGSGPAYVARFIEALTEASVAQGLSEDLAQSLALQTVLGTAQLLDEQGISPAELREAVSSPGGTTVAALDAMNEAGLSEALIAGVDAAVRRSKELAAG